MSTDVTIHVTVTIAPQRPRWASAVAVVVAMFIVAWALGWLWWLVAAVAVYVKAWLLWRQYQRARAAEQRERQRWAGIAARADQQHAWVLAGDPRGTYGDYPPALT
jgi:nitrate/nitrite transporter NarK